MRPDSIGSDHLKIAVLTQFPNLAPKEPPMSKFIKRFVAGEEGATMVEYGLMVALIAAVLITVVTALGTNISAKFTSVSSAISGGGGGS